MPIRSSTLSANDGNGLADPVASLSRRKARPSCKPHVNVELDANPARARGAGCGRSPIGSQRVVNNTLTAGTGFQSLRAQTLARHETGGLVAPTLPGPAPAACNRQKRQHLRQVSSKEHLLRTDGPVSGRPASCRRDACTQCRFCRHGGWDIRPKSVHGRPPSFFKPY